MVTLKRNFFLMVSFFVTPLVMTYPDFNDFFSRSIIGGTTDYEVISDNHVRSYTNSGNSVFVTTDTFDVLDKNTASWQWKVLIPLEANERLRRNHDFAARIIFCKSDGILPTQKRCLNYVWTDSVEKGTVWVNPWNSKQINIALRDSQDGVDTWKEEKINLVEDFKKYLNIDIKKIWGWGVITDADNTRQIASAEYKDFNFQ
ncbi:MAG: DUF3047 domain-containing protein [Burkholderiaceae bacterium]